MRLATIMYILMFFIVGCENQEPEEPLLPTVSKLFEEELNRNGIKYRRHPDGTYLFAVDETELTINLENVRRDYLRDNDPTIVKRFVSNILTTTMGLPEWGEAKRGIRLSLEPSEHDFGNTLVQQLSDSISIVVVYVPEDESRITWIDKAQIKVWGVTEANVRSVAMDNMSDLLNSCEVKIERLDGTFIAFLNTQSVFKASLILAPALKEKVEQELGWPLLAVVPARDFLYLLPEGNEELLGRVGPVVVREYSDSGYPISTEVLKLSDDGVEAIGDYQPK